MEKGYQCTNKLWGKKKQGITPQTVYMLAYKNAIANGLRTTQKLPIQNVKQFDDMIKHNNNPMNNNFWHLFTELISQLARMHKKQILQWQNGNSILVNYNTA